MDACGLIIQYLSASTSSILLWGAQRSHLQDGPQGGVSDQDAPQAHHPMCLSYGFAAAQNGQAGQGEASPGLCLTTRKPDFLFTRLAWRGWRDERCLSHLVNMWSSERANLEESEEAGKKCTTQSTPTEEDSWKSHQLFLCWPLAAREDGKCSVLAGRVASMNKIRVCYEGRGKNGYWMGINSLLWPVWVRFL